MDLVIQAPSISSDALTSIATLADAQGIVALRDSADQAFRLLRVKSRDGIAELCQSSSIDCAFVPDNLKRERVRLVAMDMDSTLITIECIDEIADMLGVKLQVASITAAAMRGEIDFQESLTRRVALLAGLPAAALQRVYDERVRLSPGAERMLTRFKQAGAKTLLVSGGFTFFTDRLKAWLDFDEAVANTLEIVDGKLTGRIEGAVVDAAAKAERFSMLKRELCSDGGVAIAMGDGANDLAMLEAADVSIAYRAAPLVRAQADYGIDYCGLDAVLNLFG